MAEPNTGFFPLPMWAPSYPESPSIFEGNLSVGLLARAPKGVLEQVVQAPLKPIGDLFQINWLYTREVRGGHETDTPWLRDMYVVEFGVPVEYNGITGGHCFLEYTNFDDAAIIGREIWGWPKKVGDFVWEETATGGYHLELNRNGVQLITTDVELDSPDVEPGAGWPDVFGVRDDAPYLQVRHRVGRAGQPTFADVISVPVEETSSEPGRAATATVELRSGLRDPLEILGPIEILGARVDRNEFIFPYGEIVDTVQIDHPTWPAPVPNIKVPLGA